MITKEMLKEIEHTAEELKDLRLRLDKMERKENKIIGDSVTGSSKYFPYTKHSFKIIGIPKIKNNKNKYRKMIKSKEHKLEKKRLQLEYELNYVQDADIRKIIRYRYNDGLTWLQIMFEMGYTSESVAKMKLKRFLKKNQKCDECDDK